MGADCESYCVFQCVWYVWFYHRLIRIHHHSVSCFWNCQFSWNNLTDLQYLLGYFHVSLFEFCSNWLLGDVEILEGWFSWFSRAPTRQSGNSYGERDMKRDLEGHRYRRSFKSHSDRRSSAFHSVFAVSGALQLRLLELHQLVGCSARCGHFHRWSLCCKPNWCSQSLCSCIQAARQDRTFHHSMPHHCLLSSLELMITISIKPTKNHIS